MQKRLFNPGACCAAPELPHTHPVGGTAGHGRLRESMDRYGVISTEVHDVGACIPDDLRAAYVNDSDRVGAMLGLDDTRTIAGARR